MEGDGFVLLVDIFSASNFKDLADHKFITKIFDTFELQQDEEVFNALIQLLINISFEASSP